MKKLAIFLLPVLLISCAKDEPQQAQVNYFLSVEPTTEYDYLDFTFMYTRAHRLVEGGTPEIRSVYLDPKMMSIALNEENRFRLGSSEIEPIPIEGYDFGLSAITVTKGQQSFKLEKSVYFDDVARANITPAPGETLNVIFQLDVASSVVLDSAGQDWLNPRFEVITE